MKLGRMNLYYNSEYGFILGSIIKIKGGLIYTILNPVMVEKANITSECLGEKILESLNV